MKAYNKAVLEVEEFILNADIADASESESVSVTQSGGTGSLDAIGTEFVIEANGNDEI